VIVAVPRPVRLDVAYALNIFASPHRGLAGGCV
jgi:hypothetical protein